MSRFLLVVPLVVASAAIAACDVATSSPTSPASPTPLSSLAAGRPDTSKAASDRTQFASEVFVDYGVPARSNIGAVATEETSDYSLTQGGIHWASGDPVTYWITGTEGVTGGNSEVEAAVATLDSFITTRSFTRLLTTPADNPCGNPNVIVWASIDGPGGILASTSVCRNVATKEIVGFTITIDSDDTWSTNGAADTFDVRDIVTHEMGHAAGLGHDNAPKDGCLTMYKYAATAETQKRTLGLGDKLGLNVLYNTGDTSPGPGCGS